MRVLSEESISALLDCMEITDWNIFREAATLNENADLQEYTVTVLYDISMCVDDVTTTRTITVHSNKKLWMTGELRSLLKTRDTAFREGDVAALRTGRSNLARVIRRVQRKHTVRISDNFADSRNPRHLWRGIQAITDYKAPIQDCDNDPTSPCSAERRFCTV